MIKKEELAKMKIAELKELAKDKKVNVPAKASKDDLIKLILAADEVVKTAEKVKETLTDNPSSTTAAPAEAPKPQKQDFFQNTPELPQSYNKDKLVLMVRDPFWGFAYWEVSEYTQKSSNIIGHTPVLRMYDITNSGDANSPDSYFDIQLNNEAGNWYIKFPAPNHSFIADYGYIGQDGNFITVLRSNAVTTPREDVSDQIDEEWMMTDDQFKKILKASGANQMFEQIGSQEMVKFLSNNVDSVKNVDLAGSANTSALLSAVATSSMFAGSSSSSPMSGFSK